MQDSDVTARIIRSLFDIARQYRESIDVYGTKKAFEWPLIEHEPHVLHTAKKPEPEIPAEIEVPGFRAPPAGADPALHHQGRLRPTKKTHLSFTQGAGHGGSHPHLVHEFVSALVEDRDPFPNARQLGQLDVRRPVRARVRAQGRRDRPPARLHAAAGGRRGLMQQFVTVTLNGLTLAALYFVVASGFTLIFGLMRVVNMAHGALYLLGGYIALEIQTRWYRPPTPASGSRSAAHQTPSTASSPGSSRSCSRR